MNKVWWSTIVLSLLTASVFASEEPVILHNFTSGDRGTLLLVPDLPGAKNRFRILLKIQNLLMTLYLPIWMRLFLAKELKGNFYLKFIFYEEDGFLKVYLFGAYTLENEFIIRKVLKYPHLTLAKRVYTIFVKLIDGFHGAELEESFPEYMRE